MEGSLFTNRLINKKIILMNKFLNMSLLSSQCQWHNSTDVHIWAVNMHVQFELFADGLDVLEAFLEVGTCATDPDLDFVLDERWGELSEGTNDTLERGCNLLICFSKRCVLWTVDCFGVRNPYICEIGNTTTNEQNFAFRTDGSAEHEV